MGNVFACQCGAVAHAVCSHCSRLITAESFPAHFSGLTQYDVFCELCRDVFCVDCANTFLHMAMASRRCYKCRAVDNAAYNDEAASAWVVTYQCGYMDRKGRTHSNVFIHPRLFPTRREAFEQCVGYVPVILDELVETALVTRVCEELARSTRSAEVLEMFEQNPGFQMKCSAATPLGPSVHILVVGKTVRSDAAGVLQ